MASSGDDGDDSTSRCAFNGHVIAHLSAESNTFMHAVRTKTTLSSVSTSCNGTVDVCSLTTPSRKTIGLHVFKHNNADASHLQL